MTLEEIAKYARFIDRAEMLIQRGYPVHTRDVHELAKHLQSIEEHERVKDRKQTS